MFLGGGWGLFGDQIIAVAVTLVYSFVVTCALVWVLVKVLPDGVRVDADEEDAGLDLAEHSETAYAFAER